MAVNLHGDLWVRMTKLLADVEDVSPIAQELRSEGVSQIVEPDVPKTRLTKNPLEVIPLHITYLVVPKDPF